MNKNTEIILKLLKSEKLKLISFDIFDTLIFRSAIISRDIFYFLNMYYQKISNNTIIQDISRIRIDCENELIFEKGVENVTIDLIYERLQSKINLDTNQINKLKNYEITLEVNLSECNQEIIYLLEEAKKIGKKVILTSDMYLTSQYIVLILNKYNIKYDVLYISADIKKRKDKGDLYDEIIFREKIQPFEILHIGDNEISDYLIPLKKGILSYHYIPISLEIKKRFYGEFKAKIQDITSIFLGFLFNEENNLESIENMKYTNLYDFGYYSLGPFLLAIMLKILFSDEIQKKYNTLFFSSRDGYLPYKVYEILKKNIKYGIPGKYIYCGRRALSIANYADNTLDFLSKIYKKTNQENTIYTVKDLFSSMNIDKYYVENMNYTSDNLNINNFISDIDALSLELSKRKINAMQYLYQLINDVKKEVIFDCGYSGSVSDYIYQLTNINMDKIYLWESEQNKVIDRLNGTKTYLFFNNFLEIVPFHLIFEELFSPLEAACIGYEKKNSEMFPVFDDNETFSDKMDKDLNDIHNGVFDYVNKFCLHFKDYLSYFAMINYQSIFDYTMQHLFNENDKTINLFANIVFQDKFFEGNTTNSLINKLCIKNKYNSFKGNIFLNSNYLNICEHKTINNNIKLKLGLHIHLYYMDLYNDFLDYLIEFPYPFDLFITYTDIVYEKLIYICFSQKIIPNLNKIKAMLVQNRGRDVAPWLIEIKNIHLEYDIFCHIHSKKNVEIGFGGEWRNYLLNNLIKKNAVIDILYLFSNNSNLGIIYPPMYKDVYNTFKSVGDPPFQEHDKVNDFLLKIGLPEINNCNEVLFSAGTMFWYRPIALKKLFYENISYNDFPEEPIGINGTLAHAIERLPSYVATNAGYETKLYLNPEILAKVFYNQYKNSKINELCIPSNILTNQSFSFKYFCKKIYYIIIRIIPGHQLRDKIDSYIKIKMYPIIKNIIFSLFKNTSKNIIKK